MGVCIRQPVQCLESTLWLSDQSEHRDTQMQQSQLIELVVNGLIPYKCFQGHYLPGFSQEVAIEPLPRFKYLKPGL